MSLLLKRDERVRTISDIAEAMEESAKKHRISIDASELSVALHQRVSFATAPIAQGERDLAQFIREERPVMYWYLSGGGTLNGGRPVTEGFFVVMAHPDRGRITLVDASDNVVGEGDLNIDVGTVEPDIARLKPKCEGAITKFNIKWGKAEICGNVTCSYGKASATMNGCILLSFW